MERHLASGARRCWKLRPNPPSRPRWRNPGRGGASERRRRPRRRDPRSPAPARPNARFRAPPTGCSSTSLHVPRRDRTHPLSVRTGHQPRLLFAVFPRPRPEAFTATTWSTTTRSTPRSARARISSSSSRRCAPTAWVTSSTSCPITWASWAPTTPGGWMCWRTGRPRSTRITSTSTGIPPNPALAGKLLVPVLGDTYGQVLERGELQAAVRARAGSFAIFYHEHRLPIDPEHLSRACSSGVCMRDPDAIRELEKPARALPPCPTAQDRQRRSRSRAPP